MYIDTRIPSFASRLPADLVRISLGFGEGLVADRWKPRDPCNEGDFDNLLSRNNKLVQEHNIEAWLVICHWQEASASVSNAVQRTEDLVARETDVVEPLAET